MCTLQNVTSSKEQTNKKKHITKQKDQITNFRSSEIRMTSAEEVEHQRRAKKKKNPMCTLALNSAVL